jgi:hypothetical protein
LPATAAIELLALTGASAGYSKLAVAKATERFARVSSTAGRNRANIKAITSVVDLKFLPELLHARRRNFKSKTTLVSYTC